MSLAEDAEAHERRAFHGRKGCFAWTVERLDVLRDLHARNYSFSYIAAELGCSRNAAIGKAHRLKLPARENPIGATRPKVVTAHKKRAVPRMQSVGRGIDHGGLMSSIRSKRFDFRRNGGDKGGGQQQRLTSAMTRPTIVQPVRKPPKDEPASLNLSLMQLTDATCKWPHGDDAPFFFCGHSTENGSYCAFHQLRSTSKSVSLLEAAE